MTNERGGRARLRDEVTAARECAVRVAGLLREEAAPKGWSQASGTWVDVREGHQQYGYVPVFESSDRSVDFSVWVDRVYGRKAPDRPILCAAFGVSGREPGRQLQELARSAGGIETLDYPRAGAERLRGYGGAFVFERPSNQARFLSVYQPCGQLNPKRAFSSFRALLRRFRTGVEELGLTALARVEAPATRILTGLVAELTVLLRHEAEGAEWVGDRAYDHDVKTAAEKIEVKAGGDELVMSLPQLRALEDKRVILAVVDGLPVTREGVERLTPIEVRAGLAKAEGRLRAFLAKNGLPHTPLFVKRLAAATTARKISYGKLPMTPGFWERIEGLKDHGDLVEFRIGVKRTRFVADEGACR